MRCGASVTHETVHVVQGLEATIDRDPATRCTSTDSVSSLASR